MNNCPQKDVSVEIKQYEKLNDIIRVPFYFGDSTEPLMGWLHVPPNKPISDTCLLICPPLSLEYMNSYRPLRYTADYYASAGIPVIRFDYHGTGDSCGSNLNENRIPSWLKSIKLAYEKIKEITGCKKIGLLGFRIGATLGCIAAEEINFDFLILWSPIEKGRKFIREIRALQKTSSVDNNNSSELLEAGGTVYWDETQSHLQSINLLESTPKTQRVLIIPKENLSNNNKLNEYWKSLSISVDQIRLSGESNMLIDAHLTQVPHKSIVDIVKWTAQHYGSYFSSQKKLSTEYNNIVSENKLSQSCKMEVEHSDPENVHSQNFNIKESFFYFGEKKDCFAIKTEPSKTTNPNLPIILFCNSGANHRVGPSRLYLQIARQLAGYGFQTYRLDIPGIGDSILQNKDKENIEYPNFDDTKILDAINTIKKDIKNPKFIIIGLCSGAYFSFHTALNDISSDITEIFMINPLTFYWNDELKPESTPSKNFSAWNWYKKAIKNKSSWLKIFSGKINYRYLLKTVFSRLKLKLSNKNEGIFKLGADLKLITDKGVNITFLFSRSDPGYDILKTSGGKIVNQLITDKNIELYFVEKGDHTFSKFEPRCEAIKHTVNHFINRYKKLR